LTEKHGEPQPTNRDIENWKKKTKYNIRFSNKMDIHFSTHMQSFFIRIVTDFKYFIGFTYFTVNTEEMRMSTKSTG